ncbi:MAG: hypothetical protein R3C45_00860 [Phycisphaerales bacterium]
MHTHRLLILLATALLLLLTGCEMETRVVRSSWDSLPADPKPRQVDNQKNFQDAAGGQGWAIQITEVLGSDRQDRARELTQRLRSEAQLDNIWIEDIDNVAHIYHGRFANASDKGIRPALEKIQKIELDGERAFEKAQLVPLVGQGRVIADPFDLRQFSGYYSLQIGFYDEAAGTDFRDIAEQAVRTLREEGHEAYYYHGPFRSIITIGVFTYDQAFVSAGNVDTYAPHIRELQKIFPFNLGNGSTINQKENGVDIGEHKSSLIRVY